METKAKSSKMQIGNTEAAPVNAVESARPIEPSIPMNGEDMLKEIERLRAENDTLKRKSVETSVASNNLTFKVSDKGAVSIYGLGRFPVTLYLSQLERLDKAWNELKQFVENNRTHLKVKDTLATQKAASEVQAVPPTIRKAAGV